MILKNILNSKIVWICLIGIITVLIIILCISSKANDTSYAEKEKPEETEETEEEIIFELKGLEEVTIYVGEEYEELGVKALLEDDTDLGNKVLTDGNVDINKVGEYEIDYILTYKNQEKKLTRKVNVIDINIEDINIRINGEEEIYLEVGEEYQELGATASYKNTDLTNEIKINNNINIEQSGNYEISYKVVYGNKEKTITRKVTVLDLDSIFKIDLENLSINVTMDDNYSYIRLPNGTVSSNQVITYVIPGIGNYEFHLFTKNYQEYKKIITVTNEDMESVSPPSESPSTEDPSTEPTGTCEAILKGGKTTVTVKSDSNIEKYSYNGEETNSSIYVTSKYLRTSTVILTGKNGKTTKINCNVKLETLPQITPPSSYQKKYSASSDTLKVNVVYKDGFYLSYIWVKDPINQLKKQLTSGSSKKPAKILETAIKNNKLSNKIVLGFNASSPVNDKYWTSLKKYSEYYLKEPSPLLIYNGKVIINDYKRYPVKRPIYYISQNNELKYISNISSKSQEERKKIFQNVIDSGVQNTFIFRPVLVNNYKVSDFSKNTSDFYKDKARRQALCQLDSNNFILITSKNGESAGKVKLSTLASFAGKLKCKIAANLDGGGSSATFFKKRGTSTVTTVTGGGRDLTSVMYFTELN